MAFYLADTLNLTPRLALTVSGRFNAAQIDLNDQNGGDLTGNHSYNRFNPAAGITYQVTPWLTAYAGYAEANRAPTPAELSCAGPANSCSLANFFVGDPDLKQVVAHTVEAGIAAPSHRSTAAGSATMSGCSTACWTTTSPSSTASPRAAPSSPISARPAARASTPGAAKDRTLARLHRLFVHRRDLPKRFVEAAGNNPAAEPTATSPSGQATGCPGYRHTSSSSAPITR